MPNQIILVLTMGRVGSTAVYDAVHTAGEAFHLHWMNPSTLDRIAARSTVPRNVRDSFEAWRMLDTTDMPVKLITLVRDATERNLSAIFTAWRKQTPRERWSVELEDARGMAAFWSRQYLDRPLRWFDDELRDGLGIDVYSQPFHGSSLRFTSGRFDVLIMRSDLDNEAKSLALSGLVDTSVEVGIRNTNEAEAHADTYARFRQTMPFDEHWLRQTAGSQYMRHFFDVDEDAYVATWQRRLRGE